MEADETSPRAAPPARPDPKYWHLLIVVLASAWFESLFIRHGMNKLDEGWPLYAAMRLHDGGGLYRDAFWVFPPWHVIPAWLGMWIDAPGLVWTRAIYAFFAVILVPGIYLLARRLMSPGFALLAALMVTFANPRSHMIQALFGYRYLIFAVIALLLFDRRLRTGQHRFTFAAGLVVGIAVSFRITPAFATSVAVGLGTLAASRDWRDWLRDWFLYAGGLLLIAAPVSAYIAAQMGMAPFWKEAIIHPVEMLQPLPWPELAIPDEWNRGTINEFFINAGFRGYWILYIGYAGALAWLWGRAVWERRPFEHTLLLCVVAWGAVFFIRSLGRSDYPHLASVIPPICVLVAHALSLAADRIWPNVTDLVPRLLRASLATAALAAWCFLHYVDFYVYPENRGLSPLETLDGAISLWGADEARTRDDIVRAIQAYSEPGDVIFDMSASPILYVLADRTGPGYRDIIMPGTFSNADEERKLVGLLDAAPPALVILRREAFDGMPERAARSTAPRVSVWVAHRYEGIPYRAYASGDPPFWVLLRPRETPLTVLREEDVVRQLWPPHPDALRESAALRP